MHFCNWLECLCWLSQPEGLRFEAAALRLCRASHCSWPLRSDRLQKHSKPHSWTWQWRAFRGVDIEKCCRPGSAALGE